jgi:hypothetical protein
VFDVSKTTRQPSILSHDRPGSITSIVSTAKAVAWLVDVGPGLLAVDFLPLETAR